MINNGFVNATVNSSLLSALCQVANLKWKKKIFKSGSFLVAKALFFIMYLELTSTPVEANGSLPADWF